MGEEKNSSHQKKNKLIIANLNFIINDIHTNGKQNDNRSPITALSDTLEKKTKNR